MIRMAREALEWCVDMAQQDHAAPETEVRIALARQALKEIRDSEPAPKLVVPERLTPPDPAWWASDLPELRERIGALEGLMAALQDHKALTKLLDHGKRLDALEQGRDNQQDINDGLVDRTAACLHALEMRDRQEQVVRDWTEWHRRDPERAERWRREHVRSIDDVG